MSDILPALPGNFPDVVTDAFELMLKGALDHLRVNAKAYGEKLTKELQSKKEGETFLFAEVGQVDEAANRVILKVTVPPFNVPLIPGLKIGLATAEFDTLRNINLEDGKPIIEAKLVSFAIEIDLSEKDRYEIRLGYAQDKSIANQSRIVLVGIKWSDPKFSLLGILGSSDRGGILIDVKAESPIAIPLATTGLGLKGIGLIYGKRFAPLLSGSGDAMERLETADAKAYVDWALRYREGPGLKTWVAVKEDISLYGISALIVDMGSSGGFIRIQDLGLAYISYGPTLIFGGEIKLLDSIDGGTTVGAIDVRSQSFSCKSTQTVDVIGGALIAQGSIEFSASLKDIGRSYVAIGGYSMDGCRISLFSLLELSGGVRLIPAQGVAARARGRMNAELQLAGFGVGYSLSFDLEGEIGWNPRSLSARIGIAGNLWLEVFGRKIGLGTSLTTELHVQMPRILKMDVDFTLHVWFTTLHFPVSIFSYDEHKPADPSPTLKLPPDSVLAIMHAPSGYLGKLDNKEKSIWPDTMFVLDFQRSAGGADSVVNPVSPWQREAGVDVRHQFSTLVIERKDPVTAAYTRMREVRACWLLNAAGDITQPSSRLAIPCNDPLAWMNRFDYAQPGSSKRSEVFKLQAFGTGPSRTYLLPASGKVRIRFEDVEVSSDFAIHLLAVPWAEGYERALSLRSFQIEFSKNLPTGVLPLAVDFCELRILGTVRNPPYIGAQNATPSHATLVRIFDTNRAEWSIVLQRSIAEAMSPLVLQSEQLNVLVAIGYRSVEEIKRSGIEDQVLAIGHYRLRVEGRSTAEFRGTKADKEALWGVEQEFEVIRPPLRPYIRYATLGDERTFGFDAGGWNPNPAGYGFGHYLDHFAQIRLRVGYLSKIYNSLAVFIDGKPISDDVKVIQCLQGTPVGIEPSAEWRVETGQALAIEEEMCFPINTTALRGEHEIAIKRYEIDGSEGDTIDRWSFRISKYNSPAAHLSAASRLRYEIGPYGSQEIKAGPSPALPVGFDFDSVQPAQIEAGWALPSFIQALSGTESQTAGLSFLHALDWCGILNAATPVDAGPFARPESPDLCLLMDRAQEPVALLLRTCEPCDWRRVEIIAATTPTLDNTKRRFTTKLIPSPDGCQCAVILVSEATFVRVPQGDLALRFRFYLDHDPLPRLTVIADPAKKFHEISVAFNQPNGQPWMKA